MLDLLVKSKALKSDGLDYFRSHWLGYVGSSVMRTLFIGYFVMVTVSRSPQWSGLGTYASYDTPKSCREHVWKLQADPPS